MKNIIAYYYNLHPEKLLNVNNNYFFNYQDNNYVFQVFERPITDIDALYKVNKEMIQRNILVHEIIENSEKNVITYVNQTLYILMQTYVNPNVKVSLPEVCYINNNTVNVECDKIINRQDWVSLWEAKNDYFEAQVNEIGKKYPYLCTCANYYIGLAENAITYVRGAISVQDAAFLSICHKRIRKDDTLLSLYNPMNYIQDYRVRDASEYIKTLFFYDNSKTAYDKTIEYFSNNYLTYKEALLFYGRLLYPSYFFDVHDDIVNNDLKETEIEKIIIKSDEYEKFLLDVYLYLTRLYNKYIPSIDWIIKRSFS